MIITEEPIWYPIYADTNNNEFEKSTLTDLDELEEDEYDEYGRKKHKGYSLKNLEISEISLCRAGKVGVKYLIQKGSDGEMDEEKELKGWEDISESELSVIRETIAILSKYDLGNDLKRSREILSKYFGEKEVKKSNFRWSDNTQRTLRGYSDSDLEEIDEEDLEIEKSSDSNPFPSLASIFNRNKRTLEEVYEEATLSERFI